MVAVPDTILTVSDVALVPPRPEDSRASGLLSVAKRSQEANAVSAFGDITLVIGYG